MSVTAVQRAMLQMKRHADFKDGGEGQQGTETQTKDKADTYRHCIQILAQITGEAMPAEPRALQEFQLFQD